MCPGGEHLLPFLSPNSYSVMKQSPLRDMGHGKLPHNNGAKWLTEPDRNFTILIHNYDQLNTIMWAQTHCKIFHVLASLETYFILLREAHTVALAGLEIAINQVLALDS